MNNKIVVFTKYGSKRKAKFKDYAGYTMLNIGVTLRRDVSVDTFVTLNLGVYTFQNIKADNSSSELMSNMISSDLVCWLKLSTQLVHLVVDFFNAV